MLGDRVEVLIDVGDSVRSFEITASRAGRRIEVSTGRGMIEVVETTRAGQSVRSARFMANRVVAIVEHPAADRDRGLGRQPRRPATETTPAHPDLWTTATD